MIKCSKSFISVVTSDVKRVMLVIAAVPEHFKGYQDYGYQVKIQTDTSITSIAPSTTTTPLHYDISIMNDNQLGSISEWGPDFTVKFEILVKDFDNGGLDHPWSDVLHFTATDKTCCDKGDRLPGVFLNRDKRIVVGMWGIGMFTSDTLTTDRWYAVEIKQKHVSINEV